jgi:acyl-ACP thioesterase
MEHIFCQQYTVAPIHTDCFGLLKPATLLHFAQEAAAGHCVELGTDWDTLSTRDLFWAVIRHKVSITRLPREGETITVETWPMPTTRVAYPRSVVALDAQGKELFRVISLWVLMDKNTRQMVLPDKSDVIVEGILRGDELSVPKALAPKDLTESMLRQVRFTDLDKNGHMNNTRYLDWVADLLTREFFRAKQLREVTLCYNQEALEGQVLQLKWRLDDNGTFAVDGLGTNTDVSEGKSRIFSAQLVFE